MELGGVSVQGASSQSGGAYLVKDLSVFETQLGGLQAFVMVSDGAADDESGGAASQLAAKVADTFLEAILIDAATGSASVVDPALVLKTIVTQANAALLSGATEPGASHMSATFCGALISNERVWFGSIGGGSGYLLRGSEAREFVFGTASPAEPVLPEEPSADDEASVPEPAQIVEPALGQEGVTLEVGSVWLNPGDAVVLLGRSAASALSASELRAIASESPDANAAAEGLANAAAKSEHDHSLSVAIWSADSALFAAAPVASPAHVDESAFAPVPVPVAVDDVPKGMRAEKIFLWVMSAWIVVAFVALGVGMVLSRTAKPSATASDGAAGAQGSVVATASQVASAATVPTDTAQSEFPKTLTVPKNVRGGVWLRRNANTLVGTNEVVKLKPGATIQAADVEEGTDDKGKTQDFYVIKVSDISAKQVQKDSSHPWPPAKSIKKVYVFAGSFE